jgi:hypothetical protein
MPIVPKFECASNDRNVGILKDNYNISALSIELYVFKS